MQQYDNFNQLPCTTQKNQMRQTLLTHISIPIELLEEILRWGWFSLMSSRERIAFMASVALVSKTWLKILIRITCRDIYIYSTSYPHDREFTIGRSPIFHKLLPDVSPSQLCQTITRQIPVLSKPARGALYIEGNLIQDMLSTFRGLSLMPNLRSLAVEYYHPTSCRKPFFPFCASIVQLHLEYTFASDCPRWLIETLLANRHSTSKHHPWALPYLEHISTPVTEDPTKSITEVLDRCPHLRLAEERFTIRVHILFSSQLVPENCFIFHGAMPSFDACVVDYHDFGPPKTIRGSAPVLVLMKDDDRVCEPSIDLSNMFRNVHVFCHDKRSLSLLPAFLNSKTCDSIYK